MLWIEPSGACNLDCPECPTAAGRGGGVMSLKDFTRALDSAPWARRLNLWHRGEPLVAPDFPEMVAEASRRGIHTVTHSNGILLAQRDRAERLVLAGLSSISVGLDGASEETYRRIRRGGSLAGLKTGVEALLEARRRLNRRHPRIIGEVILSRQTPDELRAIREMAREWGLDGLKFKTCRISHPENLSEALATLPDNRRWWRYRQEGESLVPDRWRGGCWRLAWSAVIAWNGDALPCCFDAEGRYVLGNVFNQSLREIWQGEAARHFAREVHLHRDEIAMCRNCTEGLRRLYVPEKMVLNDAR